MKRRTVKKRAKRLGLGPTWWGRLPPVPMPVHLGEEDLLTLEEVVAEIRCNKGSCLSAHLSQNQESLRHGRGED